jgi:D-alanine-D-alanine ligase-like ATP-grasp enzyme
MLTQEWLAATKECVRRWEGRVCGIAYTQSYFRNPHDIWYDRLATDVPSYIAGGLAKVGADCIYLNVEQVIELCLLPERRKTISAIFNVCLGHLYLDNWALIPALSSWADLPVLPNGAHASLLGEDKRAAKDFALRAGLPTPEVWAERTRATGPFVKKPRGWGSSVGLQLVDGPELLDPHSIVEPFVPGTDLTVTLLHDPSRARLAPVGALHVSHGGSDPQSTLWTESKKSRGPLNHTIERSFHEIDADLEQAIDAFARDLGVRSAARIDFRMPRPPAGDRIGLSDVVFLEINPCPTPSAASSFGRTISHAVSRDDVDGLFRGDDGDHSDAFAIGSLLASVNAR